jgi:hypothetical protein
MEAGVIMAARVITCIAGAATIKKLNLLIDHCNVGLIQIHFKTYCGIKPYHLCNHFIS